MTPGTVLKGSFQRLRINTLCPPWAIVFGLVAGRVPHDGDLGVESAESNHSATYTDQYTQRCLSILCRSPLKPPTRATQSCENPTPLRLRLFQNTVLAEHSPQGASTAKLAMTGVCPIKLQRSTPSLPIQTAAY